MRAHDDVFSIDDRVIFRDTLICDFRGDWFIYRSCYAKAAPSSGRVVVSPVAHPEAQHEYYPGVFNGRIDHRPRLSVRDAGSPFAVYKVRRPENRTGDPLDADDPAPK